jgi:acyl carrier protein
MVGFMADIDIDKIKSDLKHFFLTEFPISDTELTNTSDLPTLFLNDSLRVLTAVIHLEQQFGISIVESDINAEVFQSIDSLSEFVSTKLRV